jgi:NAD-dependent deacetylase
VVWFGESLPPDAWAAAEKAARECDAFLVAGTSALVHPAASLPEEPLRTGKLVVEINPEETPLSSRVTFSVRAKAGEALLELRKGLSRLADEKGLPAEV